MLCSRLADWVRSIIGIKRVKQREHAVIMQVCYQQVYNENPHNVTPNPPLGGSWLLFSRFRGKELSHSHTRACATKRHKTSDQRQTHRGRHVQSTTMAQAFYFFWVGGAGIRHTWFILKTPVVWCTHRKSTSTEVTGFSPPVNEHTPRGDLSASPSSAAACHLINIRELATKLTSPAKTCQEHQTPPAGPPDKVRRVEQTSPLRVCNIFVDQKTSLKGGGGNWRGIG